MPLLAPLGLLLAHLGCILQPKSQQKPGNTEMVFELIFIVLRRAKTEPDSIFFIFSWMVWQLASCPERVELAALAPLATGALLGTSSAHLGTAIPNIMKNIGKNCFEELFMVPTKVKNHQN